MDCVAQLTLCGVPGCCCRSTACKVPRSQPCTCLASALLASACCCRPALCFVVRHLTPPSLITPNLQVWTYLPVLTEGRQLLRAEHLCLLGDASLAGFHEACARDGVTVRCGGSGL